MKLTTLIGLLSLSLAACATDDGSNGSAGPATSSRLSKAQAANLFSTASTGLTAGRRGSRGGQQSLAPAQEVVDYTFDCDVGHFDMNGTYDYDLNSDAEEWDIDASYVGCVMSDVTMDGQLSWTHSMTAGGFGETVIGQLTVSTQGLSTTCAFDLQIESGPNGEIYTGTICGYDASEIVSDDDSI